MHGTRCITWAEIRASMTAEGMIECRFNEFRANIKILSGVSWDGSSSVSFLGLSDELVFR